MTTRTSGDDLWSIASADVESEIEESLFTAARVEASQFWPVVASATSPADFSNRMELISNQLDAVTASVLTDETDGFYATLRTRLTDAFEQDYALLSGKRTAAARRHQADLQREVLSELQNTAGAADGTEDPDFLAAPADGASGPASVGGTPGTEAPVQTSEDGPTMDDSAGPNIIDSESVEASLKGVFVTAEMQALAVNMTRQHFQHIADGIKSAPVDEATRQVLANHFATHLSGTNANFNRDRFLKASTGSRLDFSRVAVDTSSIPPEWIQHAADRATYSGSDTEWGLANRANPNSWVTEWQLLAPENVRPGEYLVDEQGNVRIASKLAFDYAGSGWTPENGSDANGCSKNHVWVGEITTPQSDGNQWFVHYKDSVAIETAVFSNEADATAFAQQKAVGSLVPDPHAITENQTTYYEAAKDDNADDDGEPDVGEVHVKPPKDEVSTQFRKKDHMGPGPKFIASKNASIDGESWDTGEVALWFANDYGLYQAAKNAGSPRELAQIWAANGPVGSVDLDNVSWNAVYNDVVTSRAEEEE